MREFYAYLILLLVLSACHASIMAHKKQFNISILILQISLNLIGLISFHYLWQLATIFMNHPSETLVHYSNEIRWFLIALFYIFTFFWVPAILSSVKTYCYKKINYWHWAYFWIINMAFFALWLPLLAIFILSLLP